MLAGLTRMIRSLALMMLIKNLGCHRRHPGRGSGVATLGDEVSGAPTEDSGDPRGEGAGPLRKTTAVHREKERGPHGRQRGTCGGRRGTPGGRRDGRRGGGTRGGRQMVLGAIFW
jgi:hypothetical protein